MRAVLLAIGVLAAGCAAPAAAPLPAPPPPLHLLELNEHFATEIGNIKVIRVQDEFRVIRCVTDGPFHGCFVDILTVPRTDLELASWMDVEAVRGLELAFITPERVALRRTRGEDAR